MRALITGGSGAIGSALVREFVQDYEVIFTYLNNKETAEKLAKETGSTAIKLDVRLPETFTEILKYPHFDLLVNNAGISLIKLFTDTASEDWENMLDVNLTGAFNITKTVLPSMIKRKNGIIINVSSVWGEVGASCEVAYSAAKAGLIGFSKALAKEVEPSGISVHYIAPGAVESPMNIGFTEEELLEACGAIQKPGEIAKNILAIVANSRKV